MKPLMRLLVVASVALLVGAGFAGPAAAAKGGNKANVELCKQSVLTGAFRNRGSVSAAEPRACLPLSCPGCSSWRTSTRRRPPIAAVLGIVLGIRHWCQPEPLSDVAVREVQRNGVIVTPTPSFLVGKDGGLDMRLFLVCGDPGPDAITSIQASGITNRRSHHFRLGLEPLLAVGGGGTPGHVAGGSAWPLARTALGPASNVTTNLLVSATVIHRTPAATNVLRPVEE